MKETRIQTFLVNATMSERRRFVALVRDQRIAPSDAQRVIERDRNRAAITRMDLRDVVHAQVNRRTVVGVLVNA